MKTEKYINLTDFTNHSEILAIIKDLNQSIKDDKNGKSIFSDITDSLGNQYVDLVLEGGGVLGIALVGYTYVLEQVGLRFLSVGGTSAGAINALLLAAMGDPHEEKSLKILDAMTQKKFFEFVDGNYSTKAFIKATLQKTIMIKKILLFYASWNQFCKNLGFNPGDNFEQWLAFLLEREGVLSYSDLIKRTEFKEQLKTKLQDESDNSLATHMKLAFISTDLTTGTKVIFPDMAKLYWADTQNVNPSKFIRASMSIPYFFQPFCVSSIPKGSAQLEAWIAEAGLPTDFQIPESVCFVDGGVMSNFPIDVFHKANKIPLAPTFGANFKDNRNIPKQFHQEKSKLKRLFNYSWSIFDSARHIRDYEFLIRNPDYVQLIGDIDTGSFNWLNFNPTKEEMIDLFISGAKAASNFLIKFNWEQYKKFRATVVKLHEGMT